MTAHDKFRSATPTATPQRQPATPTRAPRRSPVYEAPPGCIDSRLLVVSSLGVPVPARLRVTKRGPRRKPGASSYTLTRLSLSSLSLGVVVNKFFQFHLALKDVNAAPMRYQAPRLPPVCLAPFIRSPLLIPLPNSPQRPGRSAFTHAMLASRWVFTFVNVLALSHVPSPTDLLPHSLLCGRIAARLRGALSHRVYLFMY